MYFTACLGSERAVSRWRVNVQEYARWLSLVPRIETCSLGDARLFSTAWMEPSPRASAPHSFDPNASEADSDGVRISLSTRCGELSIDVAPASVAQVYYSECPGGYVFGDDLRLFHRLLEVTIDESALYALFQYGAVPAPLTIWKGVHRIPNGYAVKLSRGAAPVSEPSYSWARPDQGRSGGPSAHADMVVRKTLDTCLAKVPPGSVVYFSGGVDSSLLASRLARMGRRDIELINYSFGPADRESAFAAQMAGQLGLRFRQITHEPASVSSMLERIGQDYSYPFGDFSAVATNLLVHRSLSSAPQAGAVVEGTGADGAFGIAEKYPMWRAAYAVPRVIRRSAGWAYDALGLWDGRSSLERVGRFIRKSASMPLEPAVLAQNALADIVYPAPSPMRTTVAEALRSCMEAWGGSLEPEERLSRLDLILVCAGRMAAKSFDPLRSNGIRPLYPFLCPAMLSASSSLSWEEKCPAGEGKAILKRLLAADVPADMVYRPKSGFTPPYREMFADAPVQEFLHDVVLASTNPLLGFCRPGSVRRLVDGARRGTLNGGAYDFLWTLAFTAGWITQLPSKSRQLAVPAAAVQGAER